MPVIRATFRCAMAGEYTGAASGLYLVLHSRAAFLSTGLPSLSVTFHGAKAVATSSPTAAGFALVPVALPCAGNAPSPPGLIALEAPCDPPARAVSSRAE